MIYHFAANLVMLLHLSFVLFVVLGGLLVLRWAPLVWLHIPALAWGLVIGVMRWTCPLTPMEQELRAAAGQAGFKGGFIDHYIMPLLYPESPGRELELLILGLLLTVNVVLYWWHLRRQRKER